MAKKGGGKQTITNKLDPQTAAYQKEVFDATRRARDVPYSTYGGQTVAGVDPASAGAGRYYQGGMGLGDLGQRAMGGDQEAFGKFFNPYQANVLDQVRNQYGRLSGQATMGLNDQATAAGAFGGSRHGVAQGVALGEIGRGLGEQMAGLQYQGFNDAQQRAQQAANLGMGAADRSFAAGDYFRNIDQQGMDDAQRRFNEERDWALRQAQIMQSGSQGQPYGTSQTQPTQGGGWLGGLLGAGMTFAGLGGLPGVKKLF